MVTCLIHEKLGCHQVCVSLNAMMNTGSDSDSFDEGDLTARGRKGKGKISARANEKGKQKAKDVRHAPLQHRDFLLTDLTLRL
jgi:hypothetical protein